MIRKNVRNLVTNSVRNLARHLVRNSTRNLATNSFRNSLRYLARTSARNFPRNLAIILARNLARRLAWNLARNSARNLVINLIRNLTGLNLTALAGIPFGLFMGYILDNDVMYRAEGFMAAMISMIGSTIIHNISRKLIGLPDDRGLVGDD